MSRLRAQLDCFDDNDEYGLLCKDASLAVQSEAEEADLNFLVKKYGLLGVMPQQVRVPMPEEFYDIVDFRSAMEIVRRGEEAFMSVPAEIRARFQNDAAAFVAFCGAKENLGELRAMGLAIGGSVPAGVSGDVPGAEAGSGGGAGGKGAGGA